MDKSKVRALLRTAYQEHNIQSFHDLQVKYMEDKFIKGCEDCRAPWEVRPLGPIVHDHLWKKICQGDYKLTLCKECMRWRLGRELKKDDYPVIPWNILRGDVTEGKVMANRNIQAKRLKIKKAQRALPAYLSQEAVKVQRYNSTSPYAMKNRKFLPPDALDRSNPTGIEYAQIPVSVKTEFNSLALCQVHTDQNKSLEDIALEGWSSWNRRGTALFVKQELGHWPGLKRQNIYMSGDRVYIVEEDYKANQIKLSGRFRSISLAKLAANSNRIIWREVKQLEPNS